MLAFNLSFHFESNCFACCCNILTLELRVVLFVHCFVVLCFLHWSALRHKNSRFCHFYLWRIFLNCLWCNYTCGGGMQLECSHDHLFCLRVVCFFLYFILSSYHSLCFKSLNKLNCF